MVALPDVVHLGADEEAHRLWEAAATARTRAPESLVALCEALDLGARAVEVLGVQRLQPVRDDLPATIASQLALPDPAIDVLEDSTVSARAIQLTDLIDLMSEAALPCVSQRLHRGWEDRRFACRRARETAQRALQPTLDAAARERLLLLSAYRNRLFRVPPPVRIVPAEILAGLDDLARVVDGLRSAG